MVAAGVCKRSLLAIVLLLGLRLFFRRRGDDKLEHPVLYPLLEEPGLCSQRSLEFFKDVFQLSAALRCPRYGHANLAVLFQPFLDALQLVVKVTVRDLAAGQQTLDGPFLRLAFVAFLVAVE
uniref:Putative secreted protein n=1 Tax=Ixodes ricinus TaxID=34613 RepID=A0A6B0UN50_IXORI